MDLLDVRSSFPGGDSEYFFFNRACGPCKRLLDLFRMEWTRMGFGGQYSFKNLHTSLVHHTKDISPKKRLRVHRAMCHSEAVADKFYMTQNTASEAAKVRAIQADTSTEESPEPGTSQQAGSRGRTVTRRQLFVESSSESDVPKEQAMASDNEVLECLSEGDISDASSSSIPLQSTSNSAAGQRSGKRKLFILESPIKPSKRSSGYQVIGEAPSPGHSYLGKPFLVPSQDADLLKTSPRVKLVRFDSQRLRKKSLSGCGCREDAEVDANANKKGIY
ncbi:hypothetical protein AMEX_G8388 [Astyanax mexicanus]|uniref:Uncharacterized protein n=1 Tax=Astyanax mexicanus TaxID=7994 RepID=A0A8T2LZC0_ASTMX|nr:hypothetical protein AMEX_G8388 [Astyanax mexicanus]